MELTKKIYSTVIKQEGPADSRDLTFVISDESEDRDGDIIEVQGWQTAEFMYNPVMLCFHEYDKLPIAKFTSINKDLRSVPHRLLAVAHFPTIKELCPSGEVSEHAKTVDTIFNMYKLGVLNAVSVGCQYLKSEMRQDYPAGTPDYARGKRVTQSNLMEVSAVPVPANAHALVQLSSAPGMEKAIVDFVTKSFNETSKSAIPFKHYALADEDTEWDGPKVIADSDIVDLAIICAYKADKDEADLVKGDFKLPHHLSKSDGYKTVKAGVVAAAGAILGARGGVKLPEKDIDGVKAHLKKHYAEWDLTWPEDKAAWVEQAKALGIEVETKESKPIEQKAGRRLSADTLSRLDGIAAKLADFDKVMASIDDVQKTLSSARDEMVQLIQSLKDGEATEETEPEVDEGKCGEKADTATIIKIVG
jgi:Caudovirus prohead protease.